jgi:hypothetical protein
MNEDTKLKLVVATAGLAVAATAAGIAHQLNKRRLKKPLPGTTKIEKIYVIKDKTSKK